MVASGFTAVEDVFSGDRGFFHAYESYVQPKLLVHRLGSEFDIMQTAIKRWPVGYPIQAPLDALSNLIATHKTVAKDVNRVLVTIDEQGARTVNKRRMASINIQHLMAMMLIDGEITFASAHDNERVHDPVVVRLKKRIALAESPELSRAKTTQAVVEIITQRGERFRYHTKAVRGSATNPMKRDEVALKSRDLLLPVLGSRRTENLIDTIWNLELIGDVRDLRRLLHPTRAV
jgi:2-methylcitrate dehydratase PrpD